MTFSAARKSNFNSQTDKAALGKNRFSSLYALIPLGAVLTGVALAPTKVMAQSAPAAAGEVTLPTVNVKGQQQRDDYGSATSTIGGKTPTAIRDIPQSVTIINEDVIKAQGAASLAEALRNVPGITIS